MAKKQPHKNKVPEVAEKAQPFTSVPKDPTCQTGTCAAGNVVGSEIPYNIHRMVNDELERQITPRMKRARDLDQTLRRLESAVSFNSHLKDRLHANALEIATFEAEIKLLRYQLANE